MPESASVVQTHSNAVKTKKGHNSQVYNENVVIPKVIILKPRILYDRSIDRQVKSKKLIKGTVNFSSCEKFKKKFERLFVGPFKTAQFRATNRVGLTLGTRGFSRGNGGPTPETAQEKPLAPRVRWSSFALILLSLFC